MTTRMIYLRVPFGFEMSTVHLQIPLSGGWTAGHGNGRATQAKEDVLALVKICTVTLVNETVVCSQLSQSIL